MAEFDKGPPAILAKAFDTCPDYGVHRAHFWYDWGAVFYRGRLDGSAKVLCIASDPGATERIAGRTLVGDAGQRVQGFLTKLGLTRSYLCLNTYAYALFPSHAAQGEIILTEPSHLAWRNRLLDLVHKPALQCVIAFGVQARKAVQLWPGKGMLPVVEVPHPSSHDEAELLTKWRAAIVQLRALVTPDPDGAVGGPNYGTSFRESDYAAIPRRDLPFGAPTFLGDDAKGRASTPSRRTSVSRPNPDDRHTLIWVAPNAE